MAATQIKLESCSLVAPRRECSQTDRKQDGWLHWHFVKARLAVPGNRFSLPRDSHRFSSSVTTLANQRPAATFEGFDNISSPWEHTGFITRPSRHQIAIRRGRQGGGRMKSDPVPLFHVKTTLWQFTLKTPLSARWHKRQQMPAVQWEATRECWEEKFVAWEH